MNTNFKKNRDVAVQKRIRRGKGINLGTAMEAGLLCQARGNLMAHIRHAKKGGGTVRIRCAFCGKRRTKFVCKLCGANLCMDAPYISIYLTQILQENIAKMVYFASTYGTAIKSGVIWTNDYLGFIFRIEKKNITIHV